MLGGCLASHKTQRGKCPILKSCKIIIISLSAEESQQRGLDKTNGKLGCVYKLTEPVNSPKICGQWKKSLV